ncbi:type II toxin-antitoxin system RelE/ParE family toxin, partial [Crocosphaera watsonii]
MLILLTQNNSKNGDGRLRIRIGDYRIIYQVENNILVIV